MKTGRPFWLRPAVWLLALLASANSLAAAQADDAVYLSVFTPGNGAAQSQLRLGKLTPKSSPILARQGVGVHVRSQGKWELSVHAASDFIDNSGPVAKTIPIGRMIIIAPGGGQYTLSKKPQKILIDQSGTAGLTKALTLDYKLNLNYLDRPGNYSTQLVFTSSGNLDLSGVYPSPFSPGAGEVATIRYILSQDGLVEARILNLDNTLVKTLVTSEIQSSGSHAITWEGTDNLGQLVPNGSYLYEVKSTVDQTTIIIAKGIVDVNNIALATTNLPFSVNTSLVSLRQDASPAVAEKGDIVSYNIVINNPGGGALSQLKITSTLSPGLKYIPGTTLVNGEKFADPTQNGGLVWNVGTVSSRTEVSLKYKALVTISAAAGNAVNEASLTAILTGETVSEGPVKATVLVRDGILTQLGTIIGKVFDDKNSNGLQDNSEKGLSNAVIVTEDGTNIKTDENGLFSFLNVKDGSHLLVADRNKLPAEYNLATSPFQLVQVPKGGVVVSNFAISRPSFEALPTLPEEDDFVLVALAEGATGAKNNNRLSFYSKGKIARNWRLTTALDTAQDDDLSFSGSIPGIYYDNYGDKSVATKGLTGKGRLYLLLEQGKSSLLFGNYGTGFGETKFSRYNRSFNGLRGRFENNKLGLDFFGAANDQVSIRETIAPNDTSGPYYLGNLPIVAGSETIKLEIRDPRNPSLVVETITKVRDKDYFINYDTGRLFFSQAVSPNTPDGKPEYIIALYEYKTLSGGNYYSYGVRSKLKPVPNLLLGTTYIRERRSPADYELIGFDSTFELRKDLTLLTEYAQSSQNWAPTLSVVSPETSAWLSELKYKPNNSLGLTAYLKQVGDSFYNPTDPPTLLDVREFGLEGNQEISRSLSVKLKYKQWELNPNRKENRLVTLYDSLLASVKLSPLTLDYELARSDKDEPLETTSNITTLKYAQKIWGLDLNTSYQLIDDVVRADQLNSRQTTNINFGSRLNLSDRFSPFLDYFNSRKKATQTNQLVSLGDTVSIGLRSRLFGEVFGSTAYKIDRQADYEHNTVNKFNLISLGLEYYQGIDKLLMRYETQNILSPSTSSPNNFSGEFNQHLNSDLSLNGKCLFNTVITKEASPYDLDAWLGLLYRPIYFDKVTVICRGRLVRSNNADAYTRKIYASTELVYLPDPKWLFSARLAKKDTWEKALTSEVASKIEVISARVGYNFAKGFDLTGEERLIYDRVSQAAKNEYSVELGYNPLGALRVALGYNFNDYVDEDNQAFSYSAKGGYIKLTGTYNLSGY